MNTCKGSANKEPLEVQDDSPDVRQSAFALAGDLAKVCKTHLTPVSGNIFRLGIAQLQPAAIRQDSMSACNNACWSLGKRLLNLIPASC